MSGGGHGGGPGRRKKHEEHEEHENHERWLVSYADMMTLLMVLFIVLFAMSQVDKEKFNQLRHSLSAGFGGESVAFQGRGEQVQEQQDAAVEPAQQEIPQKQTVADKELQQAVQNADRAKQSQMAQHAEKEVENLEAIKQKILEALEAQGLADAVRFTIDERGLVVTIVTSGVVFGGDQATLLDAGREILDGVGPSLASIPNRIQVDGHTNQLPMGSSNYPSGWELSSARASSVVRYLHDKYAIVNERLSATGFADTRPLYPATDARAVTLNRRVEVVILSTLPAEERALLPGAAGEN